MKRSGGNTLMELIRVISEWREPSISGESSEIDVSFVLRAYDALKMKICQIEQIMCIGALQQMHTNTQIGRTPSHFWQSE